MNFVEVRRKLRNSRLKEVKFIVSEDYKNKKFYNAVILLLFHDGTFESYIFEQEFKPVYAVRYYKEFCEWFKYKYSAYLPSDVIYTYLVFSF